MRSILFFLIAWAVAFPVGAAIVTDNVDYEVDGVRLLGYLAYDDSVKGPRPGVLVVHEWWGLNEYAKKRTRELARMGYVAFAADMYGNGRVTRDPAEAGDWSGHLQSGPLLRKRARAALDVLAAHPGVDRQRLGAIGFCFGGTTILELAYDGAPLRGLVTFHAGLPAPKKGDIGRIKPSILVLHGADDGFVSRDSIDAFRAGLNAAGADWQMVEYSGTVHSFSNPDADSFGIKGVSYNPRSAARAWREMGGFFDELFVSTAPAITGR